MIGKVADGYNDFYFADDHTGNVKAVKDALDTFDVKGKVQLAKVKFSNSLDTKFNDMIQRQKGVESFKEFSKATAQIDNSFEYMEGAVKDGALLYGINHAASELQFCQKLV